MAVEGHSSHSNNKRVKFDKTTVQSFLVHTQMYRYPRKKRKGARAVFDKEYRDRIAFARDDAINRASKLEGIVQLYNPRPKNDYDEVNQVDSSDSDSDASPAENTRRKWIVDSGCGHDLIGKDDIGGNFNVQKAGELRFNTAGGKTTSNECVEIEVSVLNEKARPIILDSTPPVLSIGRRCMEKSYGFYWPPKSRPYLVDPNGKKIKLKVIGYIPYLIDKATRDKSRVEAVPSEKEVSSSASKDADAQQGPATNISDTEQDNITLPDGSKNQMKIATSIVHLMTHYPKNPYCQACNRSKIRKAPSHASPSDKEKIYKHFGDHITADLKTVFQDKNSWGMDGQRCVLVVYDSATKFIAAYPLIEKTAEQVAQSFTDFAGDSKIKYVYCDGGPELVAAAKSIGARCDTSTPHTPKRNAIAEEKVKRILYTSRTLLEHAGLDAWYWPYSVKAAAHALNIVGGRNSPYFSRHAIEFQGKFIPFGCLVDYLPTSNEAGPSTSVFSPRGVPGIFIGYHFCSGGMWGHSHKQGDYLVADFSCIQVNTRNRKPTRHRVTNIVFDKKKMSFPMKADYERRTRTLNVTPDEATLIRNISHQESINQQDNKSTTDVVSHADEHIGSVQNPDNETIYSDAQSTSKDAGLSSSLIDKDQIRTDKALPHPSILPPGDSDVQIADPLLTKGIVDKPESKHKDTGGDSAMLHPNIPKRFIPRLDDPNRPPMYTKKGKLIYGEWVGDTFIRYKAGTTRPEGMTTDDWKLIPDAQRKKVSSEAKAQKLTPCEMPANCAMPVEPISHLTHRDKIPLGEDSRDAEWFASCVAKSIGKREALANPAAKASLDKEWDKLRRQKCWNEEAVMEWSEVVKMAKQKKIKAHVGRIFDICVEKNAELALGHPNRKFKGRVVFQGNNVKDQDNNWAIFAELSSAPATMQAGKAVDAFGALCGHSTEQADGESAYTQAKLGGDPTWVRLPKERWPESWKKFQDPVCPLILALYGHPDAGGFWERHCNSKLMMVGFTPVHQSWMSVYRHERLNLMLAVYVDDFKLSGPTANLKKGWDLIGKHIKLEKPSPLGRYLGCLHVTFKTDVTDGFNPSGIKPSLQELLKNNVADTKGGKSGPAKQEPPSQGGRVSITVVQYDMREFLEQCIEKYQALTDNKVKLRRVDTPFIDEAKEYEEYNEKNPGRLKSIASKVLMKCLYAARMARYDLLRPITALAKCVTKWTPTCDKMLHKLMCYIYSTISVTMYGWIGDKAENLEVALYCDADFAGDRKDAKSQTGMFLTLAGQNSNFPLNAFSKKQGSTATSTPEAEIVAACDSLKVALPHLDLWETMLGRKKMTIRLMEDNESAVRVLSTGKNLTMSFMVRTQRVNVQWLHERCKRDKDYSLVITPTNAQAADILTKFCTNKDKWNGNMKLINHFEQGVIKKKLDTKTNVAVSTVDSSHAMYDVISTASNARTIIEVCCGKDSIIGNIAEKRKDCNVVRVTLERDFRSEDTINQLKRYCLPGNMFWYSLPCTGGSPWYNINKNKPGGAEKQRAHIKLFLHLWKRLEELHEHACNHACIIAIEWPRGCSYWKHPRVIRFIDKYGLMKANFDGCMLGIKSASSGLPIKKPWTIATSSKSLYDEFNNVLCMNHSSHAPCEGKDTKLTENYSVMFANRVHSAHCKHLSFHAKSIRRLSNKIKSRSKEASDACVAVELHSSNCQMSSSSSSHWQPNYPWPSSNVSYNAHITGVATGEHLQAGNNPLPWHRFPMVQPVCTGMPALQLQQQQQQYQQPMTSQFWAPVTVPTMAQFQQGHFGYAPQQYQQFQQQPRDPWDISQQQFFEQAPPQQQVQSNETPKGSGFAAGSETSPHVPFEKIDDHSTTLMNHQISVSNEARAKHEMAWASYSVKTLEFLKPVLSLEDKVSLSQANLEKQNLTYLLNVLADLQYHSVARALLSCYYDPTLTMPPPPVTDLTVRDCVIDISTDSCLTFIEPGRSGTFADYKHGKVDFPKDLAVYLQGNTGIRHVKQDGGVVTEVFKNMVKLREKCIFGLDRTKVGVAMFMGNDAFTKKPKKLRQYIAPEVLNSTRQFGAWMKQNYDVAIMVIGGSAKLWQEDERFDVMMEQVRAAARETGCLVLSGSQMFWGVITETVAINREPTKQDMMVVLPDLWHPRHTAANKAIIARFVSQCIHLGLAARVPKGHEAKCSLVFTDKETKQINARLEEIKVQKGCTYVPEDTKQPKAPPPPSVFGGNILARETADTPAESESYSSSDVEIPLKKRGNEPASSSTTLDDKGQALIPAAKKVRKFQSQVLRHESISIMPTVEEFTPEPVEECPDYTADNDDEPGHIKKESTSTTASEVILLGGNTEDSNIVTLTSKPKMLHEVLSLIDDVEAFYPVLDNNIMQENDFTLEQWLEFSKTEREGFRDKADPRKVMRKNGFLRDTTDSILTKVLMSAIFGEVKKASLPPMQGSSSSGQTVRDQGGLTASDDTKEETASGPGVTTETEQGKASESPKKTDSNKIRKTSGNQAHTSSSSSNALPARIEVKRVQLGTLETNLNKRRQNSRRVEDRTERDWSRMQHYNASGIPPPPPPMKTPDPNDEFVLGKVSTKEEQEAAIKKLTGQWRIIPHRFWLSKMLSGYLRGIVADRGEHYRTDGFVRISQIVDYINEVKQPHHPKVNEVSIINEILVNGKKRFESWTSPDGSVRWACAVQGHRRPMILEETEFNYDTVTMEKAVRNKLRLWHGTRSENLASICTLGITPGGPHGGRIHVHCSDHPPGSNLNQGGCRFDAPVGIELDARWMLMDGYVIRRAKNGAFLTRQTIHPKYIVRIVQLDACLDLYLRIHETDDYGNIRINVRPEEGNIYVNCGHCNELSLKGSFFCLSCGMKIEIENMPNESEVSGLTSRYQPLMEERGLQKFIPVARMDKSGKIQGPRLDPNIVRRKIVHHMQGAPKWYAKFPDRRVSGTSITDRFADDPEFRVQMLQYGGTALGDMANAAIETANKGGDRDDIIQAVEAYEHYLPEVKDPTTQNPVKRLCLLKRHEMGRSLGFDWKNYERYVEPVALAAAKAAIAAAAIGRTPVARGQFTDMCHASNAPIHESPWPSPDMGIYAALFIAFLLGNIMALIVNFFVRKFKESQVHTTDVVLPNMVLYEGDADSTDVDLGDPDTLRRINAIIEGREDMNGIPIDIRLTSHVATRVQTEHQRNTNLRRSELIDHIVAEWFARHRIETRRFRVSIDMLLGHRLYREIEDSLNSTSVYVASFYTDQTVHGFSDCNHIRINTDVPGLGTLRRFCSHCLHRIADDIFNRLFHRLYMWSELVQALHAPVVTDLRGTPGYVDLTPAEEEDDESEDENDVIDPWRLYDPQ